jgi:hypothetical protein
MIRRKFFVAFVGALDVFCGDEVGAFEKFRLMKNPIGGDRPARMDSKSRRKKKEEHQSSAIWKFMTDCGGKDP